MSRPLRTGDPSQLGPFRLTGRLSESSAGIVFLGLDRYGRQVGVAVLTRGAAQDAAARDRFRAGIMQELPGGEQVLAGPTQPPEPGEDEPAAVVAAQPDGPAPWVATLYDAARPGAERFLDPVLLRDRFGGQRSGRRSAPRFQPHWFGSSEPAVPLPAPVNPAPVAAPGLDRRFVTTLILLAALLAVFALLLGFLFGCRPQARPLPTLPPNLPAPSQSGHSSSPGSPSPQSPGSTPPSPSGTPGSAGPGENGAQGGAV